MKITQSASAVDAEAERLRALARYAIIDTPADDTYDRIARVAARCFGTPMASVSFVDEHRIWFKAVHGAPGLHELPRDEGLSSSAILDDGPFIVGDLLSHPLTADHPLNRGQWAVRFYAAAPIVTPDGHRIGAVTVADTVPREPRPDDVATLHDLAAIVMDELELRRSALTAVRVERRVVRADDADRATIADYAAALQRSLLPPTLPIIPGMSVAAHYHPAFAAQVGGDFYDVFALDPSRWAFFIGDVEGHGTTAASVTALVRHTLRAAALHHDAPAAGLAELNAAVVKSFDDRRFCTALFGKMQRSNDIGEYGITLATGGHQPALLLDPERGEVRPVRPDNGMLIGAVLDARFDQCDVTLHRGQTLLMFTDGIVEARPDGTTCFGEQGLMTFLHERVDLPAAALIGELATLIPSLHPDDDVALLAMTVDRLS